MAKLDAAQFFKSADLERGLYRIEQLLTRVQKKSGLQHVAVSRSKRVLGHLCKKTRRSDRAYKIVGFQHIRHVLEYVRQDRCFTLGNAVLYRRCGWPQGGPLSEPGTLVDLNQDVLELHENRNNEMIKVGWHVPGHSFNLSQLVLGLLHVDDSLLISRDLCVKCLESGVSKMWPSDVGVSLEEQGDVIRYLNALVFVLGSKIKVAPFNPNVCFALGFEPKQKMLDLATLLV